MAARSTPCRLTAVRCPASVRARRAPVDLESPHLGGDTARIDLDAIVDRELPGGERAGDHGAEALHGEDAVDGQARGAVRRPGRHRARQGEQRGPERVAGPRRCSTTPGRSGSRPGTCRPGAWRRPRARARASRRSTRSVLVSATMPDLMRRSWQIARCSRVCGITPSSAAITSSARSIPPTPASMFFTKRSWPGTSTISITTPPSARVLHEGEAEVDGDAARLLLRQAVGVDAGQGPDQRGLAVIDVAGGADDDVLHVLELGGSARRSSPNTPPPVGRCARSRHVWLVRSGARAPAAPPPTPPHRLAAAPGSSRCLSDLGRERPALLPQHRPTGGPLRPARHVACPTQPPGVPRQRHRADRA